MIIIITGYCLLILDLLLEKEYLNIQPCDLVEEMRPLRHVYVQYKSLCYHNRYPTLHYLFFSDTPQSFQGCCAPIHLSTHVARVLVAVHDNNYT